MFISNSTLFRSREKATVTTFRGTLVRPRFLPPSRRCLPPPSFIRISSFPLSHSIHFQSKLPIYRRCCEREKSPFLASFSRFCRTEFRTKWRDLSLSSAMDGWMAFGSVGQADSLSLDSVSDETKRAEWVLGFAQKTDITGGQEKPLFGVEYPFRYSLPLVT